MQTDTQKQKRNTTMKQRLITLTLAALPAAVALASFAGFKYG